MVSGREPRVEKDLPLDTRVTNLVDIGYEVETQGRNRTRYLRDPETKWKVRVCHLTNPLGFVTS